MKTIAIISMSAFLLAVAGLVIAQDTTEKDACQISATTCLNKAEILQKRIKKLNAQITKGNTRYNAADLEMLEQKLQETMNQLDKLESESAKQLDKTEGK
jgi:hypothetical protein